MTVYYIKNSTVFSKETDKIQYSDLSIIKDINTQNTTFQKNKDIIKIITDIDKKRKEVKISKPILNFDELKNEIKTLDKKKFENPKDDDYDFIAVTSSIEIIESILNQLKTKDFSNIEDYIKRAREYEKIENKNIDEEINFLKRKTEYVEKEMKDFIEKNMNDEFEEIRIKSNEIGELLTKKIEFEKDIEEIENRERPKSISNLINKKNNLKDKLDSTKSQIKILEQQKATLVRKNKIGIKKSPNTILMILTLGLIYWTKYSDVLYIAKKLDIMVEKRKEKILKIEQKIKKNQRNIEKYNSKHKTEQIKIAKEIVKKQDNIEKKEIETNRLRKEIESIKKKLKPYEKHIAEFNKKKFDIEVKIQKLKFNLTENEKNSSNIIEKSLNDLKNKQEENIEKLNEIRETIGTQKVKIKKDCIVNT